MRIIRNHGLQNLNSRKICQKVTKKVNLLILRMLLTIQSNEEHLIQQDSFLGYVTYPAPSLTGNVILNGTLLKEKFFDSKGIVFGVICRLLFVVFVSSEKKHLSS